jgi:ryanodine receptor 2
MEPYSPCPIDTTAIELTAELENLAETLARHVHEVWAQSRIAGGQDEHPCLVHYDRLPESEKDIDRRVVRETLKALIILGYTVSR